MHFKNGYPFIEIISAGGRIKIKFKFPYVSLESKQ